MSELPREPTAPEPSLPIPMRQPFSKRRRELFLLVIVAAVLVVIGVAIYAVTTSPPAARPKVLSADDRKAPLALRREAAKVNFAPTTIEGIGTIEKPHPLQQAFIDEQAAQCGYCVNGVIMTAKALLDKNPKATEQDVEKAMSGVICRCHTHVRMLRAINRVREAHAKELAAK